MENRMIPRIAPWSLAAAALLAAGGAWAKLPPPSDEAKAKAAEAAAKTAWSGKVDNYKLCLSMDRVASYYQAEAKKAGKDVKPAEAPACADPGPFVYPPPAAAAAPAAPAAPTATAAAPAPAPKK
jgi:hypothetical protein